MPLGERYASALRRVVLPAPELPKIAVTCFGGEEDRSKWIDRGNIERRVDSYLAALGQTVDILEQVLPQNRRSGARRARLQ